MSRKMDASELEHVDPAAPTAAAEPGAMEGVEHHEHGHVEVHVPVEEAAVADAAAHALPLTEGAEALVSVHTVATIAAAAASVMTIPSTGAPSMTSSEPTKKTGRPAHPLWAHFHRGEKRNRYHYHAYCVYCVERYGAASVPATRGVSIDMLRHLEKCTNCPRKVVEHVKEVCGRRDAVRFDRYGKKKQQQQQKNQQDALVQQTVDPISQPSTTQTVTLQAVDSTQQAAFHQILSSASTPSPAATSTPFLNSRSITTSGATVTTSSAPQAPQFAAAANASPAGTFLQPTDSTMAPPAKRLRGPDASVPPLSAEPTRLDHQIALLKFAIAAGLSPSSLQNSDVQQMLCELRPSLAASPASVVDAVFSGLLEPKVLKNAAARLAALQLERVKEGMLNSTIKGGLTLSLHSWSTLDGQHLVAFNLVNSNGDSSCVCVEDMATYVPRSVIHASRAPVTPIVPGAPSIPYTSYQLADKIEDILQSLQEQNISVMGIVADSTLGLNAARRVCLAISKHRSLLVVPCFSRVLSVLAGAVLTHPHFVNVVGEMIEIAAYLLNDKCVDTIRTLSGDPRAYFVLPNRENWFSFVECHNRLLRYRDAIVEYCSNAELHPPHVLKTLVLRNDQSIWKQFDELRAFLTPLHETYSVFFQQIRTVHTTSPPDKTNNDGHMPSSDGADAVDIIEDDLTAAHGLTLAHVMYQFARMTQQYQTLLITTSEGQDVAQLVLIHVDTMWRRYELPAMLMAFAFNFHLDTTLLDMAKPCSSWPSIAQYFQLYYERWFGDATISRERIGEILDAIKLNQFPFDADTTSDYIDVSSFYSFVSDSHPEICALCCRLYAISLLTANATRIVRGIGFVPNAAQTTRDADTVELLLHVGFASSMRRNLAVSAANERAAAASALGGMEGIVESGVVADSVLWSEDIWQGFADDWRLFVDQELLMDEFDTITDESAVEDGTAALLSVKVPVQDLFVDTLPPMTMSLEAPVTPNGAGVADTEAETPGGTMVSTL